MPRARATSRTTRAAILLAATFVAGASTPLSAQSLRGSPRSMDIQTAQAHRHDFSYLTTASRVASFVEEGYLVRIRPNLDFDLHQVSFPFARPEVATFIERLARQYRGACGEKMVVTSLTRPTSRQPRNASARSVHPTGMAVDLRYPRDGRCRGWLEGVLLDLEGAKVVEATRERYPAHYHVAVFPRDYASYVTRMASSGSRAQERQAEPAPQPRAAAASASRADADDAPSFVAYEVRKGDSLWTIARRLGTTVDDLQAVNDLRGSRIYAGQVLEIPRAR